MKWATLWGKKGFAINFKSYKMSFPNAKKVAIETTLRAWGLCNGSSSDVRDPSKLNAEQFKELVQMAKDHDFELVTFRTRQQQDGDGVALDVLAGTLSLIERGTTLRQIPI